LFSFFCLFFLFLFFFSYFLEEQANRRCRFAEIVRRI